MALHWAGVLNLPVNQSKMISNDKRILCVSNSGMVHCRFTINKHIDQQHCLFRPSKDMGEQENNIYFRGTRE